jgi:hypothetical protein
MQRCMRVEQVADHQLVAAVKDGGFGGLKLASVAGSFGSSFEPGN